MKRILLICTLLLVLLVGGCKSKKDKIVGSWYREKSQSLAFTLYDDGTCEIPGEYGTGTWAIVNDNQFKLMNYYGESETATIKEISENKMVLSSGEDEVIFIRNPQE